MATPKRFAVGSRNSPLALAQTEEILRPLRALHPDVGFEIVTITTQGDKYKDAPLLSMAKGMFVKEIEAAILDGEVDLAVHSAKDLTAALPDGLTIAAFGERKDPRDVLIDRWHLPLRELPPGARLGTSSPRRTSQLKVLRPDIEVLPIRGNVGTRIAKLRGGDYDGVVLAAAGLMRLSRQDEVSEYLSPDVCTPEVGQGALAVEVLATNLELLDVLAAVDHRATRVAVTCERVFLKVVGGGCKVPVAAYCWLEGDQLVVSAMAALPDGSRIFRVLERFSAADPEQAGQRTAEALMETGAAEIISRGAG